MSEFTPDEQRVADAFTSERAGARVSSWRARRARRFGSGGTWLRPAAAIVSVAVVAGALGSYFGLRAHFAGDGTGSSSSYPSARAGAAMAYDPATGTVVLFGGFDRSGKPLGDTWSWGGSGWVQQHPATSPPGRSDALMAYDAATHRLVLFGGVTRNQFTPMPQIAQCAPGPPIVSTAEPQGVVTPTTSKPAPASPTNQPQAATASPAPTHAPPVAMPAEPVPSASSAPAMICTSPVPTTKGDTWTWDGSTWTHAGGGPDVASELRPWMATDPVTGHPLLVMEGPSAPTCIEPSSCGSTAQAWSWDGSSWRRSRSTVPATSALPGSQVMGLALDPSSGHLGLLSRRTSIFVCQGEAKSGGLVPPVGFAGSLPPCSPRSTPSEPSLVITDWTGSAWGAVRTASTDPKLPFGGSLVADEANHTVVFTGFDPVDPNGNAVRSTTWIWNGSNWSARLGASPDGVGGAAAAFDADTGQVVLFGGLGLKTAQTSAVNLPVLNATWTWDGSSWTLRAGQRAPAATPAPSPSGGGGFGCAAPAVPKGGGAISPPPVCSPLGVIHCPGGAQGSAPGVPMICPEPTRTSRPTPS